MQLRKTAKWSDSAVQGREWGMKFQPCLPAFSFPFHPYSCPRGVEGQKSGFPSSLEAPAIEVALGEMFFRSRLNHKDQVGSAVLGNFSLLHFRCRAKELFIREVRRRYKRQ